MTPVHPPRTRSRLEWLILSLALLTAVLAISATAIFVLLRTTGIGPYQFPGESRPLPVIIEALALLASGASAVRGGLMSPRLLGVAMLFAASGFLAVQAVAFAFSFDPTSVALQLASVAALLAGVCWLLAHGSRASVVVALVALPGGVAIALFQLWLVNLL